MSNNKSEMKQHKRYEGKYADQKKGKRYESESSSSSESESECEWEEHNTYEYLKYKLLEDKQLMLAGSDAYTNAWSNTPRILLANEHPIYDETTITYNVDHPNPNAPFFVREDGVYVLFFVIDTAEASQYTIFVNAEPRWTTTSGNNAGAGQAIIRPLIALKKNDNVTVRNFRSSNGALSIQGTVGGLNPSLDVGFTIYKIAPLDAPCYDKDLLCKLSHKKRECFREWEKKLLCDPTLLLEGFNVHGVFLNKEAQSVATEAPLVFNQYNNVYGLCPIKNSMPMTGATGATFSQIKFEHDGVYKIFFIATSDTAAQFAFFVNGAALNYTIIGTNKGAGQLTIRAVIPMKRGDIFTVVNHISGNSEVTLSQDAGGRIKGASALLNIIRISPLKKPDDCKYEEKHYEKYCELYREFKQFLLENKHTQLDGSDAFISVSSTTPQTMSVGQALTWNTKLVERNVCFTPGKDEFVIEKSGDYDVFADIITDRPAQYTIFVNNQPVLSTTSGRDSGANRTLLRQIVSLKKGDVLSVRNYESLLGNVTTATVTGGFYPSSTATFLMYKLNLPKHPFHYK